MTQTRPTTNTRDQALEVAERLLLHNGYLGVSMDDVAKGVGIRKASLYHHFPGGKEQLMMDLAERLLHRDETGFRNAIASQQSARAQLQAITEWMASGEHRTERMLRDALRFMHDDHRRTLNEHFYGRLFAQIHGVMQAGIQQHEFREHDTRLSTFLFLGMLSEMNEFRHHAPKNMTDHLMEMFVSGIEHRPP